MYDLVSLQPVDYLVVGHVSMDITPDGYRLGGTVAYSALTARALGLRVGIVTSFKEGLSLVELADIPIVNVPAAHTTTFENISTPHGRRQVLHQRAESITFEHIPQAWRTAPIVHLAPIADEVEPSLTEKLSGSLLGVTPQGWMRTWNEQGQVSPKPWQDNQQALEHAGAVILSVEDVAWNLELVEEMSHHARLLCLTEGAAGSVLYWSADRRRFRPPVMQEVDGTGAGDIFAAAFFYRLYHTRDPWEAARFSTQLAARSVARVGLDGIPTTQEIEECLMEVLK